MKIDDAGLRIEDQGTSEERGAEGLNPQSSILNSAVLQRLRWRCRRGLLELDIVLGRFVEHGYAALDDAQKIEFDVLLDLPDTVLWDRIGGKAPAEYEAQKKMLELINAA